MQTVFFVFSCRCVKELCFALGVFLFWVDTKRSLAFSDCYKGFWQIRGGTTNLAKLNFLPPDSSVQTKKRNETVERQPASAPASQKHTKGSHCTPESRRLPSAGGHYRLLTGNSAREVEFVSLQSTQLLTRLQEPREVKILTDSLYKL